MRFKRRLFAFEKLLDDGARNCLNLDQKLERASAPVLTTGRTARAKPEMRRDDAPRQLILGWNDVDALIDQLVAQVTGTFDSLLMITRGGIIPGGMIAEALDIRHILTAAVEFPSDDVPRLLAWPTFLQFPEDGLTRGRRILVVDDVWTHGRHIMTVRGRVEASGSVVETAVLHYKPHASLFPNNKPTYYAAVTDAFVVYPWEVERRPRLSRVTDPIQG